MPVVKVVLADGNVIHNLDSGLLQRSVTLQTMMRDLVGDGDILPLQCVDTEAWEKVYEWLDFHKDSPPTLDQGKDAADGNAGREVFTSWEVDHFLKEMSTPLLYKVNKAAFVLKIQPLVELTYVGVARLVKGKSILEIREILGIK